MSDYTDVKMADTGLVNRIIPFSCVDGPGNRCAVFFQGCDFRCRYCHNPETQNLCIGCGTCVDLCPTKALSRQFQADGSITVVWNPKLCCGCDACITNCPHFSSPKVRRMTVEEIEEELGSALAFVTGITVSGGECTLQHEFIVRLFSRFHELGKTCFVDTNGQLDFRSMPELTEAMDMAMLDVKAWDSELHRKLTGQDNQIVLGNLDYLAKLGKLYEVRTVIVPGYLNDEETVRQVAKRIADYPQVRYKLIKYRSWGVRPPMDVRTPEDSYMERLAELAREQGVRDVIYT